MLPSSQQSCSVKTAFVDAAAGFEASAKPPATGRVATDSAITNANIVRTIAIASPLRADTLEQDFSSSHRFLKRELGVNPVFRW